MMMSSHLATFDWPRALRRYVVASGVGHLAWEIMQLPLYTIWSEPAQRQAFAVLHCTAGDLMIAGLCLIAAIALAAPHTWPEAGSRPVWLLLLFLGVGYTIFSEWLNVNVRGSWAYSPLMPTLPLLGTGLTPLIQWIVIPTVALKVMVATPRRQS